MKGVETSRVEPDEIDICGPWNVSSPDIGWIASDTEPVELPEFVTIIDADSVSPTYPGSPDTAKPDPPDVVKLVELFDWLTYFPPIWVESS